MNLGYIDREIIAIQHKLLNMLMECDSGTKLYCYISEALKKMDNAKNECRSEIQKRAA